MPNIMKQEHSIFNKDDLAFYQILLKFIFFPETLPYFSTLNQLIVENTCFMRLRKTFISRKLSNANEVFSNFLGNISFHK